ncbi:MAG: HRDC domain-containing protein [Bacteroidales bacterium]|nr:HRDC domain-containing protein [Bacteroidales bacterium]
MDSQDNEQLKLAYEFVLNTNKNIFLTGKAGTGKTTFLQNLRYSIPKRMIVVAPTGVAAINAGGVTIHSFFQLSFAPFIPGYDHSGKEFGNIGNKKESDNYVFSHKISRNKIKLIRSLDLLIIDEISMVRADLLDAIDDVLRRYRHTDKPFGGVQLLMIGDLHQLAPVVKEDEWNLLREHYQTAYFFSSLALQKTDFTTIELKHIYRQEDETFITLLGEIRENCLSEKTISLLNSRYIPDFKPGENEGYITLTTHNANANNINESKLAELKSKIRRFKAYIKGDFPEYMFPTEFELELKKGAQVMFIKNDSSFDKLYYNGKIGQIEDFDEDNIIVKCKEDDDKIFVGKEIWKNVKYHLNDETKEIEEEICGSFEQYPLKLAWAITIHKSQGLTFEKAVIDANAAFAFGQVYVALSRCKSLEGLVLISKISSHSIRTDSTVNTFNKNASDNRPDSNLLYLSKLNYQQELILELFDFDYLKKLFFSIRKKYFENSSKFSSSFVEFFDEIAKRTAEELIDVNTKFIQQLKFLFKENIIPEEHRQLQDRIKKASQYFLDKLNALYLNKFADVYFDSDNKEVKKDIAESIERFELILMQKINCLTKSLDGFETISYHKTLANTEIDFKPKLNKKTVYLKEGNVDIQHKNLYAELNAWRKSVSEESGMPIYMILPQKTVKQLVEKLPANIKQLSKIKGFGKVKINRFGEDILEIIDTYCEREGIKRDTTEIEELKPKKTAKIDTKQISYDLYKQGKNIAQIALERGYVESTIFGHLSHFVLKGELELSNLIAEDRISEIKAFLIDKNTTSLRDLVEASEGNYGYSELRLILELEKQTS